MKRDDAALLDIARAARTAYAFALEADTREGFYANSLVQSAVLHQLMVMGEATKRLSTTIRESHPDIPWRFMARMRDRLIRHYDGVDFDITWDTVMQSIPEMLAQLEPLLPDVDAPDFDAGE